MSSYNDVGGPVSGSSSSSAAMNAATAGGAMEAVEMDPGSGASFFSADYKRHDDLKQMLDSSKDSLKLEAMKRIISMVAKGRDAGDLFPAVVKNVVSKNIEVKKLVYVYLTRYAEEQQDLALLSISTFQRALKDPNQLIRASALRVLSSIRVPVIVPIMMLSIRDSAVDMSPFVRKTAAHAIPKLYSLDPDQKEELVGVIEKLLGDRTTLVVGSAVMAFEEVCPERIELVHKNYRKLCNLLVDVEEWGQVVIVNMLSRYARTQFVDPNAHDTLDEIEREKDFYENSASDDEEDGDDGDSESDSKRKKGGKKQKKQQRPERPRMDPDHRLLLRSAKPLLQSRNASVVMATAQLYHHCAPRAEVQVVAKAMIRLLRSHREVQAVVLNCIASMTCGGVTSAGGLIKGRNSMFEPHLRSFFVSSNDPTHIKILKLEIITNMATQNNIGVILREFQSYITGQDKVCVAATIQAIGRCAASIEEVTDTCLNGLVHLLSNRDQAVVAESVVVIKKLLQSQSTENGEVDGEGGGGGAAGDHRAIIVQMARLVDSIDVPAARAAILWVTGEYCQRVPKVAPDVLRKAAKSFVSEAPEVKMQVLNLAAKLCVSNPDQTRLLAQYVFNLARYDQDYDIRDRARLMRAFVFPAPGREDDRLVKHARKVFLAVKPAPVTESKFKDRDVFQLGSLSHFLNARAAGYQDLPEFPNTAPDRSVRDVEPPRAPNPWAGGSTPEKKVKEKRVGKKAKAKGFYSEESTTEDNNDGDSEDSSSSSASSSDGSSSSEGSGSSSGSSSSSGSESEEETVKKVNGEAKAKAAPVVKKKAAVAKGRPKKREGSDPSSESSSSEEESEEEEEEETTKTKKASDSQKDKKQKAAPSSTPKSNLDLLLDLSSEAPPSISTPMLTPSLGGFLSPSSPAVASGGGAEVKDASPCFVSTQSKELINKMNSGGLQVLYRYTRKSHIYSAEMCSVELTFNNLSDEDIQGIKVGAKRLAAGLAVHEFPALSALAPGGTANATLGINFNDTTQAAKFDLVASGRCHQVTLDPSVGELVRAVQMPENAFAAEEAKLGGMNEAGAEVNLPAGAAAGDEEAVKKRVYEAVNVLQVPSSEEGVLKFSGRTLASKSLVLLKVALKEGGAKASITINCEKIVVGSMLAKELKAALQKEE